MNKQLNYLLSPIELNKELILSNHIVMAPMTRCKANKGLVPNPDMATYYAKRANSGLIITEATIVSLDGQGYPNTPGIFSPEQIEAWQYIANIVHAQAGKIFLQLWHVGRVSHPMYLNGKKPIAPSTVGIHGRVPYTKLYYEAPRALLREEIPNYINYFVQGAENAILAGFDGVEIHGGNGYLIDQFLHYNSNHRHDDYGNTPENMSRFLLEIVDAMSHKISSRRIGVRLSPAAYVHDIQSHPADRQVFSYLLKKLNNYELAYIHAGIDNDFQVFDYLERLSVSAFIRKYYHGAVIACGGYTPTTAETALAYHQCTLVAFGRPFLANPDLVSKLESQQPLVVYSTDMLHQLD